MIKRPDDAKILVFGSFLRAHQQVSEALNKNLVAERGISLPWYDVLFQLSLAEGGRLRLQDLAERVLYSRSGLTRLVDRMETSGLISREPCPHDKRGTFAVLTPLGKRELRRSAPTRLRGIEEFFFSKLSDDDAESLGNALRKVLAAAQEANGTDPVEAP
ncbi:MAG: MarR family transcriptional regulator [Chloroflexi bacterium]|nr:MarR family transcriptional regulator [Chloroflexota bacterium]